MKNYALHEIAKFGAGLVVGDFLCGWWLLTHQGFPFSFLGITFTAAMATPWMLLDLALFIVLVHYGWSVGESPLLEEQTFLVFTGTVFGIVAIAHFLRIFFGAGLVVFDWAVPLWISWIGTALATYLAYMSFHLAFTAKK